MTYLVLILLAAAALVSSTPLREGDYSIAVAVMSMVTSPRSAVDPAWQVRLRRHTLAIPCAPS